MDVRHRLVLTGTFTLPWDVRVSPFVIASSGRPYDITIGRDVNGDTVFADRPSFASDPSLPGVVQTEWGNLNPTPLPGETIVPRNLAEGPGFWVVNLRVGKSIRLRAAQATTPCRSPADRARAVQAGAHLPVGRPRRAARRRPRWLRRRVPEDSVAGLEGAGPEAGARAATGPAGSVAAAASPARH